MSNSRFNIFSDIVIVRCSTSMVLTDKLLYFTFLNIDITFFAVLKKFSILGILSHTFPVKNQTNLVMMNIFLYQDHSFFLNPNTNFSLTLQRDAFAGACDFVALVKQLSCERYLICFAFRKL